MELTRGTLIEFYEQLGRLFYIVAAIDREVNPAEVAKLKKAIRQHWLTLDGLDGATDGYGTDLAFQIEVVFDWYLDNGCDTELALADFKAFVTRHPSLFDRKVRQLVLDTVYGIAVAFSGYNKGELVLGNRIAVILNAAAP